MEDIDNQSDYTLGMRPCCYKMTTLIMCQLKGKNRFLFVVTILVRSYMSETKLRDKKGNQTVIKTKLYCRVYSCRWKMKQKETEKRRK